MAREMLTHSHNTTVLKTAGKRYGMTGNEFGTLAERSGADDGILGVIVDVEHRGKINLNAHSAALACHLSTILIEQHVVV